MATKAKVETRAQFMARLKEMKVDKDRRNAVVCALIGHSRIQHQCFGYYSCSRCETQVGDTLAGVYDATKVVVIGHNCKTCRANFKALGWQDKLFAPDPFKKAA